ncbi:MAG: nucleoside triphosphate pyrophosphohydrolase family protein [Clostridia bacterium]
MTINEYQQLALRTANHDLSPNDALLNGLMGLNGEAGEAIDLFKKHLFQGHAFSREHTAKELGDIAWYLALSAYAIDYSLEDILRMNVEKLRGRYPDGFDRGKSVVRDQLDV